LKYSQRVVNAGEQAWIASGREMHGTTGVAWPAQPAVATDGTAGVKNVAMDGTAGVKKVATDGTAGVPGFLSPQWPWMALRA